MEMIRDGKKEYEIAKLASEKEGCWLPEEHEFHSMVANTPAIIRLYFHLKGWMEAMDGKDGKENTNKK